MTNYKHDIEKYLMGGLTPAEMHALEKKALTDPFLADALEGSELISEEDLSADLKTIQEALSERLEIKQRSISPWAWTFRIAAGLLALAVTTYIIFSLSDDKGTSHLALDEQTKPHEQPLKEKVITEAEPKNENNKKEIIESENQRAKQSQTYLKPDTKTNLRQGSDLTIAKDKAVVFKEDESIIEADEVESYNLAYLDTVSIQSAESVSKVLPTTSPLPEMAKRKEQEVAGAQAQIRMNKPADKKTKVVKGTVTDAEDGTALPGVNVTIKDTKIGTVTDAEGNFQIPLEDLDSELVFSFIGLQNVEVPVNNEDNLDIKMSADYSELSEIVVMGYAEAGSGFITEEERNIYSYAEPKDGRKAYKTYLAQNLHYPQQAIENKIEGKVTVQFIVETSGVLNEFKVLRGIGYGCDEEVIRLVKNGPRWSPSKRNDIPYRGKVKIRMRFTLPD
jgi:TonB family protein